MDDNMERDDYSGGGGSSNRATMDAAKKDIDKVGDAAMSPIAQFDRRHSSGISSMSSLGSVFASPPKGESLVFAAPKNHSDMQRIFHSVDGPSPAELQKLKPRTARPGERTVSTSIRLRRQGFTTSKSSNFALKSIRRGSDDWNALMKPFVSDLVFRSLEYRRYQSEVSFKPYTCQAACLFVDLSGYSKITAAIADRGAHALSGIVNAYLEKLLAIVHKYGGDVVKFAGDAVLVVWEGEELELEINLLAAAKCAMEMQETAGTHVIEGTSLCFRIHCGLSCGSLESEIFAAPNHTHMQRLFHSVGGESLVEISELVDVAKAGEICVSDACAMYLGSRGTCRPVEEFEGCNILTKLECDSSDNALEIHIEQTMSDRLMRRNRAIEESFIHPSVLRLLGHGGLSPTHIAQMRNLCVLFIAMTSNGNSVNWLMEVQSVLDRHRCPIIQIIDDDKGVHLVAAVNLYEAIPETSVMGLEVCCDLVGKQVGCAIGMAMGPTFCGITGSSKVACRWDITGPPAVRAARLMQFALKKEVEVVIDLSVYNDPVATTRMTLLEENVAVKGSPDPIPVYTISTSKRSAAFRVLETVHGPAHDGVVKEIQEHIEESGTRCAIIVTGASLAGKKIVCQRAAGYADLVPYLHVSDDCAEFVQLARTIATWFQYSESDDVVYLADQVLHHLDQNRWSRAHDVCIELCDLALEQGFNGCFVIDRVQFLDQFSLSLLRECLHEKDGRHHRGSSVSTRGSQHGPSERSASEDTMGFGKLCFLCTHVSLYNWKSASQIVDDITRSHRDLNIPIVPLGEASREEFRALFLSLADMHVEERWLDAFIDASGSQPGYFIEKVSAIRNLSGKLWSEGKRAYIETTEQLVFTTPPGCLRKIKDFPVRLVSAEVAMRFSQVFDGLPPLFQTLARILSVSSRTWMWKMSRTLAWEVLNDIIADGVESGEFNIVIEEMLTMHLIKGDDDVDEQVLSFQSPALGDVAWDVSTPTQIRTIGLALIDRLEPMLLSNFRIPFVVANLHGLVGNEKAPRQKLWQQGYSMFLRESGDWDKNEVSKWEERFTDEIREANHSPRDILGKEFPCATAIPLVSGKLQQLKAYHPPISFGGMGHSLAVIHRNLFHTYGAFHGYSKDRVTEINEAIMSASKRYIREMSVVEHYLSEHEIPGDSESLEKERILIGDFATPPTSDTDVERKVSLVLDVFVPRFVEDRRQRLHKLADKLREGAIPQVVQRGDPALRRAYEAMREPKCRPDVAQDALMILATSNWKPTPTPEFLPLLFYQTVARIRNKVLKRLTQPQLLMYKHQQTHIDLEAFLIVTPLLSEARKRGEC